MMMITSAQKNSICYLIILLKAADHLLPGYWHHHVVRLSVTLCIVALRVGVQG